jgi:hypothetical protein
MHIRSPFARRWLIYGALVSILHLCAAWFFGLIIDGGVITGRLTAAGDWLTFPGIWLQHKFGRDIFGLFPSAFGAFYNQHEVWFYVMSFLSNSALWGFTTALMVLYSCRRLTHSHFQHENAA